MATAKTTTGAKTTGAKTTTTKPNATSIVARANALSSIARAKRTKVASKICRVCGLDKPLTEYRAKASRPDGRDSICAEDARLWLANRKRVLANATKPVAKPKTKPVAKPVAKTTTKRASATKPVAKPVALPAREAAARARDAKPRTTSTAK